jgi:hypothetical protein
MILNTLLKQAISGTTPIKSKWYGVGELTKVGLQLSTTGTVTGAWSIQGSNLLGADGFDDQEAALGADITGTFRLTGNGLVSATADGGGITSPSSEYAQVDDLLVGYIRVVFTPTGGEGSVVAALAIR